MRKHFYLLGCLIIVSCNSLEKITKQNKQNVEHTTQLHFSSLLVYEAVRNIGKTRMDNE